jgi:hypothetical protein
MSSRHTGDYKAIFRALVSKVGGTVVLKCIVSDFEAAIWRAVRSVFGENVEHHGCTFHWCQAVWRKMQENNLATAYLDSDSVHRYCRRLMSLPFLPAVEIPEAFDNIQRKATAPNLIQVVSYVERTWIASKLWPPAAWSAYRRNVRTNNDCESWHARLNRRAVTGNLPMYKLITLLHRETLVVEVSLKLLSEDKLQRRPKRSSAAHQKRLDELWTEYENGTRSVDGLLRACSRIYTCNK